MGDSTHLTIPTDTTRVSVKQSQKGINSHSLLQTESNLLSASTRKQPRYIFHLLQLHIGVNNPSSLFGEIEDGERQESWGGDGLLQEQQSCTAVGDRQFS